MKYRQSSKQRQYQQCLIWTTVLSLIRCCAGSLKEIWATAEPFDNGAIREVSSPLVWWLLPVVLVAFVLHLRLNKSISTISFPKNAMETADDEKCENDEGPVQFNEGNAGVLGNQRHGDARQRDGCNSIRATSSSRSMIMASRSTEVKNPKLCQLQRPDLTEFSCNGLNSEEKEELLELLPRAKNLKRLQLEITDWTLEEAQQLSTYFQTASLEEVRLYQRVSCPLPFGLYDNTTEFFVSPIDPDVLKAFLQGIAQAKLKTLAIDCPRIRLSALAEVTKYVSRLEIGQMSITEQDARKFAFSLKGNTNLQALSLFRVEEIAFIRLFNAMSQHLNADNNELKLLQLRYLELGSTQALSVLLQNCCLDTIIWEHINWTAEKLRPLLRGLLSENNSVSKLEFRHCAFVAESRDLLVSLLQSKPNLKSLGIYHLVHTSDNRSNQGLGQALSEFQSTSLTTLELVDSIPEPQLHQVFPWECVLPNVVRNNPQLETINLKNNYQGMSNQHLLPLIYEMPEAACLQQLDLSCGSINQIGIQRLAEKLLPKIEYLNLSRNIIGDEGAVILSEWLSDPQCRMNELLLDWCKITPLGVRAILSTLRTNRSLLKLSMMWCHALGHDGVTILSQVLPTMTSCLQELSLSSVPSLEPHSRGYARHRASDARYRRLENMHIAACQKAVVQAVRDNTSLTHFEVRLAPSLLPSHVSYFGRRNELYHLLRKNENNPQLDLEHLVSSMNDCLHKPHVDSHTTCTQLAARTSPRSHPKNKLTEHWDVSLWHDCLTRRPDLVSLLTHT